MTAILKINIDDWTDSNTLPALKKGMVVKVQREGKNYTALVKIKGRLIEFQIDKVEFDIVN